MFTWFGYGSSSQQEEQENESRLQRRREEERMRAFIDFERKRADAIFKQHMMDSILIPELPKPVHASSFYHTSLSERRLQAQRMGVGQDVAYEEFVQQEQREDMKLFSSLTYSTRVNSKCMDNFALAVLRDISPSFPRPKAFLTDSERTAFIRCSATFFPPRPVVQGDVPIATLSQIFTALNAAVSEIKFLNGDVVVTTNWPKIEGGIHNKITSPTTQLPKNSLAFFAWYPSPSLNVCMEMKWLPIDEVIETLLSIGIITQSDVVTIRKASAQSAELEDLPTQTKGNTKDSFHTQRKRNTFQHQNQHSYKFSSSCYDTMMTYPHSNTYTNSDSDGKRGTTVPISLPVIVTGSCARLDVIMLAYRFIMITLNEVCYWFSEQQETCASLAENTKTTNLAGGGGNTTTTLDPNDNTHNKLHPSAPQSNGNRMTKSEYVYIQKDLETRTKHLVQVADQISVAISIINHIIRPLLCSWTSLKYKMNQIAELRLETTDFIHHLLVGLSVQVKIRLIRTKYKLAVHLQNGVFPSSSLSSSHSNLDRRGRQQFESGGNNGNLSSSSSLSKSYTRFNEQHAEWEANCSDAMSSIENDASDLSIQTTTTHTQPSTITPEKSNFTTKDNTVEFEESGNDETERPFEGKSQHKIGEDEETLSTTIYGIQYNQWTRFRLAIMHAFIRSRKLFIQHVITLKFSPSASIRMSSNGLPGNKSYRSIESWILKTAMFGYTSNKEAQCRRLFSNFIMSFPKRILAFFRRQILLNIAKVISFEYMYMSKEFYALNNLKNTFTSANKGSLYEDDGSTTDFQDQYMNDFPQVQQGYPISQQEIFMKKVAYYNERLDLFIERVKALRAIAHLSLRPFTDIILPETIRDHVSDIFKGSSLSSYVNCLVMYTPDIKEEHAVIQRAKQLINFQSVMDKRFESLTLQSDAVDQSYLPSYTFGHQVTPDTTPNTNTSTDGISYMEYLYGERSRDTLVDEPVSKPTIETMKSTIENPFIHSMVKKGEERSQQNTKYSTFRDHTVADSHYTQKKDATVISGNYLPWDMSEFMNSILTLRELFDAHGTDIGDYMLDKASTNAHRFEREFPLTLVHQQQNDKASVGCTHTSHEIISSQTQEQKDTFHLSSENVDSGSLSYYRYTPIRIPSSVPLRHNRIRQILSDWLNDTEIQQYMT